MRQNFRGGREVGNDRTWVNYLYFRGPRDIFADWPSCCVKVHASSLIWRIETIWQPTCLGGNLIWACRGRPNKRSRTMKRFSASRLSRSRGFTLVELLVVIA